MRAPSWAELLFAAGLPEREFHSLDRPALSSQLAEIWQHARAAWPAVEIDAQSFMLHLARHLPEHVPAIDYLPQMSTADLYLACACAMGNLHAFEAFERHCLSGLDRALGRLRCGADVIAEVKQRIRCRVLVADGGQPRIADFTGRGALRGWVRVMAVREALRMTRRAQREVGGDDTDRLQAVVARGSGLDSADADHQRAFARAFDRALRGLEPRERTMLRQHVIDGLTIDQLGALYRVHRATAARTLDRARRSLLAATRADMRAELDVSSTELSSILRTIRSRLDVTLRGLRRRRPG